ncbi:undecaprenyl-phosphate glucose phosphotransferase [Bradyrhizobium sp. BR13661]|jgi:Undecaprenyl-phosphate glucose phosphotransferase|uniref:undecaprenyl-phosphate glucose phosphotransferase n=1 Tax=Bradyrhizobium sp. BR13661 TaxID=2940622 RepID=UPI0024745E0D|nr:undecaprenyl-phosphate glucose phosphotransferase [Bradyrhizobium sp. BR13661]MDH6258142.1 Undecaprenyl-phosphate glucose phosphotransferase [Bradyrhizobium sp. BR13661]
MTDITNLDRSSSAVEEHARRPRIGVRFEVIEPLFALADALVIVVAGILGGVLYQRAISGSFGDAGVYAGLGLVASSTYVLAAYQFGLYRMNELLERERDHGRVWASWCLAILVLAVVLFLLKSAGETSRGSVVCFFLLGGFGLVATRRLACRCLSSALMTGAIRGRPAIVIGTQSEMAQFGRRDLLVRFGLDEIERVVLPRDGKGDPSSELHKLHVETAQQRVRGTPAEEIVLALSWARAGDIELVLDRLRAIPLPVRLLPDCAVSTILRRQTSIPQRSYMVELQRAPLTAVERLSKRVLDVTVAATSLFLLSPVLVLAALAIKLESDGPIIFRQRRHGFNGQPFVIYKLRSMKVLEDGAAVVQATKQDPRVTRVGRFLRETSIDELPQLLNVLQGNMSMVGPRPHALAHDYEYGKMIANYAFRHHVKPGITGWAQVQGCRGGTPQLELMEKRVKLDLWYIDNWSLAFDISIMFRTAFELIRPRNAY